MGPQGPKGDTGPAGTFTGTFNGPVELNGAVTVNGKDLFSAVLGETYPAVMGLAGAGQHSCGAPASLNVSADVTPNSSAAFGRVVFTKEGSFSMSAGLGAGGTVCSNLCSPPLTFFLTSKTAQTIVIDAYLDDGGSAYIDGVAKQTFGSMREQRGINVPAGPFALSFVSCSTNGDSIGFAIYNTFLKTYDLTIDLDRTFHRNGK